jgi:carbonic anhydrase
MKKLINGIIDFREHSLADYRAKFSKLAAGQSPDTLFIACCDSRVVPNVFASSDPGDLFVLRNIGNLVPPYGAVQEPNSTDMSVGAAIEFALKVLKVKDIVICGHSECGAMETLLADGKNLEHTFVAHWLTHAWPAYKSFEQQTCHPHLSANLSKHNQLSQVNVLEQIEHLKTYPLVREKLDAKEVKLHGWWFDLATADVHYYNPDLHKFTIITKQSAEEFLEKI